MMMGLRRGNGVAGLSMQRLGSATPPAAKVQKSQNEILLDGAAPSKFWLNPFPLKPYTPERRTIAKEVAKNVFTFEQEHGFANVSVNIRMTVVRLEDGGLWVHAPVAPTAECIAMVKALGEVKHVVLSTSGLEHKIFMAPFVAKFPDAKVWVAPGQWSWPVDVPLGFRVDGVLQDGDMTTPWASEIEQKVVYAEVGIGKCSEVAFFHKKTASLLVTDAVIYISDKQPEVLDAFVKDEADKWQKSALMACFLGPPYVPSFDEISNKLFVSPVVRTFIYERTQAETLAWVDDICQWNFKQIIPAHLDAPIQAGPREFKEAFKFLSDPEQNPLPKGDMGPLNAISKLLSLTGLVPPRVFGEA